MILALMAASVTTTAGCTGVVAVFVVVYLGMFLGGLPRLKPPRRGGFLLGAIAVIGWGPFPWRRRRAVDLPTVLLLLPSW